MDLHCVVNSVRGVLAVGFAGPDALPDCVVVAAAIPAHRHHGRCDFQVPALDPFASRTCPPRSHKSERITSVWLSEAT